LYEPPVPFSRLVFFETGDPGGHRLETVLTKKLRGSVFANLTVWGSIPASFAGFPVLHPASFRQTPPVFTFPSRTSPLRFCPVFLSRNPLSLQWKEPVPRWEPPKTSCPSVGDEGFLPWLRHAPLPNSVEGPSSPPSGNTVSQLPRSRFPGRVPRSRKAA